MTSPRVAQSTQTWIERTNHVKIISSAKTDLLWAAVSGPSIGGFGSIAVPTRSKCFVVVMSRCRRKNNGQTFEYFAHLGSLYIETDLALAKQKVPVYRPTKDDGCHAAGSLGSATLCGNFKVLQHPAKQLALAAAEHVQRVAMFIRRHNIVPHGLISVSAMLNCTGYAPLSRFSFDTVSYERATFCRDWEMAVSVACWMLHCAEPPQKYPTKLWRAVATLALTLLSGPYPLSDTGENRVFIKGSGWTRSVDSRNHPAFGLFTNKDCDGKAWAICEFFYLVQTHYRHQRPSSFNLLASAQEKQAHFGQTAAHALLSEFAAAYMVSLMVNSSQVDGTAHAAPSGHCFVMLTRRAGDFADGTFVTSCNLTHGYWTEGNQTLSMLFPNLTFYTPMTDCGGYFFVKPCDLSLYLKIVFIIGRDGAYVVSGHSTGSGRQWNQKSLSYSGPLASCRRDPYSPVSVLMGCSKIIKLPEPPKATVPSPQFRLPAKRVKELLGQPIQDADRLPVVVHGKNRVCTLAAPYTGDRAFPIGMAHYTLRVAPVDFCKAEALRGIDTTVKVTSHTPRVEGAARATSSTGQP